MAEVLMAQAAAGAVPWGGAGVSAAEGAQALKALGPLAVFLLPLMLGGDTRQVQEEPRAQDTLEGGNIAGHFDGLQKLAADDNGILSRLSHFLFSNSRPGISEAGVASTRAQTEDALAHGRDGEAASLIAGTLKELTQRGFSNISDTQADRAGQSAAAAYRAQHPLPSNTAAVPPVALGGSSLNDVNSGLQNANRTPSAATTPSTPALNTQVPAVTAPPQVTQANVDAVSQQVQSQLTTQERPVLDNYAQRIAADSASLQQLLNKTGDQPELRERYSGVSQSFNQLTERVGRYNALAGAQAAAAAYPSLTSFNDSGTGLTLDVQALPAQQAQVQQHITAAQGTLDQRLQFLEQGIAGQQKKLAAEAVAAGTSALSQNVQVMDQRIAAADQRLASAGTSNPEASPQLAQMQQARDAYSEAGGDSLRALYGQTLISSGYLGEIKDDQGRTLDRAKLNTLQQQSQQSLASATQRFDQASQGFDQALASVNPGQPLLPPAQAPGGLLPPASDEPGRVLVTPPPADWGPARTLVTPPPGEPPNGGNNNNGSNGNEPPGGGGRFSLDPDTNKKIAEVLAQTGANAVGAGVATAYANWPNHRTSAPITDPESEFSAYLRDPKAYAAANYNNIGGAALPTTIDGSLLWDGQQQNLMMRIPPDLYNAARQQAKDGGWTSPGQGTPFWIDPQNDRLMTTASLGDQAVQVQLRPPASSEGALNYSAGLTGGATPTSGVPGTPGWSGNAQVTIGQQDGLQWNLTGLADFSGSITPQRREVLGIFDHNGDAAAVARVYQNGNIGTVGVIGTLSLGGPNFANVSDPNAPNQVALQTLAVSQVVHRVTYAQITAGLSQPSSPADRDVSAGAASKYAIVSETDVLGRFRVTQADGTVQLADLIDEWDARNVTIGKVGVGTSGSSLAQNLPNLMNPSGNLAGLNPFSGSAFTADSDGQSFVGQYRWQAPDSNPANNPTQVPAQFRIDPAADGSARLVPRGMVRDVDPPANSNRG